MKTHSSDGAEMKAQPDVVPLPILVPAALFLFILPTNHTMALRVIFLFAALAAALVVVRKHGMPAVPIRWPLVAWAALALVSVTWSEKPAFSLGEIKIEIGYGMAAFISFFILTRGQRELRLWTRVAAASLAMTMVLALAEYWSVQETHERWDIVHGYASYSTYLVTAAPFLGLWLATAGRRWRMAGYGLIAPYLGVAYLLGNRMFWVSLAGVLAVFAALSAWRYRHQGARLRVGVVPLVGGILLCGALFVMVANQKPVDYTAATRDPSVSAHLVGTFTRSERLYMWAFWVERIKERPWTGVGFGRDLPHWVYEKPKEWPNLYFAHAHNLVLDYGVQMGIPGIVVLFWLFGAIAVRCGGFARSSDETLHLVGATGLALVVAFFSKNMADELFWRTDALVFWSFSGVLLGYGTCRMNDLSLDKNISERDKSDATSNLSA